MWCEIPLIKSLAIHSSTYLESFPSVTSRESLQFVPNGASEEYGIRDNIWERALWAACPVERSILGYIALQSNLISPKMLRIHKPVYPLLPALHFPRLTAVSSRRAHPAAKTPPPDPPSRTCCTSGSTPRRSPALYTAGRTWA